MVFSEWYNTERYILLRADVFFLVEEPNKDVEVKPILTVMVFSEWDGA